MTLPRPHQANDAALFFLGKDSLRTASEVGVMAPPAAGCMTRAMTRYDQVVGEDYITASPQWKTPANEIQVNSSRSCFFI